MPPISTLYILYNADASLLGKLSYTYRKITCSAENPACAACDITHGGLHLDETKSWKEVRRGLEEGGKGKGVRVRQLHRDEVEGVGEVKAFVEKEGLKYPMVLGDGAEGSGGLRLLMDREELGRCGGDGKMFVERLREKGVLGGAQSANL